MSKTKEQLQSFEKKIFDLFEEGSLPYMIHFSGGNEDQLIDIFKNVKTGDYVLSNHRAHYHYLLAGGSEDVLEKKIRDGKSMHIFDKDINFLTTSILAGMAAIAVGIAETLKMENSKNKVWCFIGDGAEDEGHFYEAVRYVDGWGLPCTFIIEDNNLSSSATKEQRRGSSLMVWPSCVLHYKYKLSWPHIGTGTGRMLDFSRFVKS